jgi:hypothetical protein
MDVSRIPLALGNGSVGCSRPVLPARLYLLHPWSRTVCIHAVVHPGYLDCYKPTYVHGMFRRECGQPLVER